MRAVTSRRARDRAVARASLEEWRPSSMPHFSLLATAMVPHVSLLVDEMVPHVSLLADDDVGF